MMQILVALVLLAASVALGLQALPAEVALENYMKIVGLIMLPLAALYLIWGLADRIIKPQTGEFETDRRLSRIVRSPWKTTQ